MEFYDATKSKGMDWGNLKSKFETFSKYNQMLKKFENDNTSLTSKEIEELYKYITSNNLLGGISSKASTGFANYKKAADAYNKTLNGLTAPLQQALKNMVDSNNNNATVFQILMIDKMVENLKDFPADKRKNFIAERDRLKRQLSGYNADHTEKSNKLLNEGVFSTIAYIVKQITEEAKGIKGKKYDIEELMADVTMTSNIVEFRTHKNGIRDPYFHQGNDFSAWGHEGILYCPSKFPTKDNTMLEADEITVLNVSGGNTNPLNNYITIVMVNHKKGIIFSTYHHVHEIYVKKGDKIKPGAVLGNYWKYLKNLDTRFLTEIGYASPNDKPNNLIGSPVAGAFTIYQKGTNQFYAKNNGNPNYFLLEQNDLTTNNIKDKNLKFKNEHFHIERRFISKQEYITEYLKIKETFLSVNHINLSQNFTKHFNNHENLKKLTLNSSFGNLITASSLLDTNSATSRALLKDMENLRDNIKRTPYFKKNHGASNKETLEAAIVTAEIDALVRDYVMLLMFENIVKLACEFRNYTGGKDNCNLSELQSKITKVKNILTTQKFLKLQK